MNLLVNLFNLAGLAIEYAKPSGYNAPNRLIGRARGVNYSSKRRSGAGTSIVKRAAIKARNRKQHKAAKR